MALDWGRVCCCIAWAEEGRLSGRRVEVRGVCFQKNKYPLRLIARPVSAVKVLVKGLLI